MTLAGTLELLLKAIAVIAGGVLAVLQARSVLPASRSRLKADLEILRLIDRTDPLYVQVKGNIDRQVDRVYPDVRWRHGIVYSWTELVLGGLFAIGFATWTFYLDRDGFRWWSLITGLFTFSGISLVVSALDGSRFYQVIAARLKADLRSLITAQESFFADNVQYADAVSKLRYFPSKDVQVRLTSVTGASWAATARHEPTGLEYGIYVGQPPEEHSHRREGEPFAIAIPDEMRRQPSN